MVNITLVLRRANKGDEKSEMKMLEIRVSEIQRLCVYPLRWLCFVGYAITGVEGQLHRTSGDIDYDEETTFDKEYFYVSLAQRIHDNTFIDPFANKEAYTNTSVRSSGFRNIIQQRDGNDNATCPFTRHKGSYVDAAHLIPVKKGDQYIKQITEGRKQVGIPERVIKDIDDPRNGIMVSTLIHRGLFKSVPGNAIALILCTPTWMVDNCHVPAPRVLGSETQQNQRNNPGKKMMTLQWLNDYDDSMQIFHNLSAVDAQWGEGDERSDPNPSKLVMDYLYGCAVLDLWGCQEFKKYLVSQERFQPQTTSQRERKKKRNKDKDEGVVLDEENNVLESDVDVYSLRAQWNIRRLLVGKQLPTYDEVLEVRRREQKKRENEERAKGDAKVMQWRSALPL